MTKKALKNTILVLTAAFGLFTELDMAKKFVAAVNRHGGDATLVELPKIGITGNTHFLMGDLNNDKLADLMAKWLHEKKLDS